VENGSHMGEMRSTYRLLSGIHEENHLSDINMDRMMTLK
jgi:hypothetical protein